MDAATVPALIGIVGLLIAQVVAAWLTIKNGQKVDAIRRTLDTNAQVLVTTAEELRKSDLAASRQLSTIHDLTNSNLTSLKAQLVAAEEKIGRLEQLVTDLAKKNKVLDEQS